MTDKPSGSGAGNNNRTSTNCNFLSLKEVLEVWACCDAATSYCLKFQIYTGASDRGTEHGLSHQVIFDLLI